MKRFTETEKWRDPWFQSLTHGAKLLFLYICDNCNNAGFYEANVPEICFHLGIDKVKYEGALKGLEKAIKGASGWLWVKNFLKHQKNDPLNSSNPAHRQIISLLRDQVERFSSVPEFIEFIAPYRDLLSPIEGASKGLQSPTGKGNGIGNMEEEVQEEELTGKKQKAKGTQDEVRAYCDEIGISMVDADWFFDKCKGNGWKNGGQAIKDWRAVLRSWRSAGYLPSQKNNETRGQRRGPVPAPVHVPEPVSEIEEQDEEEDGLFRLRRVVEAESAGGVPSIDEGADQDRELQSGEVL